MTAVLVFCGVQKAALRVFLFAGADQLQVAGRPAQNAYPQRKHDAICMLQVGLWLDVRAALQFIGMGCAGCMQMSVPLL